VVDLHRKWLRRISKGALRVKDLEIIAENLKKAGFSLGWVSAPDP
jgi:hypothetical protein